MQTSCAILPENIGIDVSKPVSITTTVGFETLTSVLSAALAVVGMIRIAAIKAADIFLFILLFY
jgi:hypothetical protein